MLNLREYRDRTERFADHLPWAALVAPGVVLNKDGSFLRVLAFRGPDLESATEAELVSACARANNALRRFGSGWALFFDAERREAMAYPDSDFPDAASWLVDRERRAAFEAEGAHFESRYHLTLTWLPPADATDRAASALVERPDADTARDWRGALASFIAETDRVLDLLGGIMAEIRALDDDTFCYASSEGTIVPADGVFGGSKGAVAHIIRDRGTPGEHEIPANQPRLVLSTGQSVRIETPGGGGFGAPETRDVAAIAADLRGGRVTPGALRAAYGDEALTEAERLLA